MSQVRQLLCHKKSCHNNDSIQKKSRHKGVNTKNNHVTSESILKPQKIMSQVSQLLTSQLRFQNYNWNIYLGIPSESCYE